MAGTTITEKVEDFVRKRGQVRRRDVEEAGLPPRILYRLRDRGDILQVGPGLFRHPDAALSEKHTFAKAAKLVPRGVVCLISALAFHEIGTQMPRKIWMALDRANTWRPEISEPPMEFVWFSDDAFSEGQEVEEVEGVPVRVYSPAKTVTDLFKYRKKLGVDVAIEALREGWRERRFTMDEIEHYADICRVQSVMRPYLHSLVAGS